MRLSYLPTLRRRFVSLLTDNKNPNGVEDAITLMDEYGLDRDDVLEKMDEFKMDQKDKGFGSMDSKKKSAFTKLYNAGTHKSQAIVGEQGKASMKKSKRDAPQDNLDPDTIDDDDMSNDNEKEEEEDLAKLAVLFKKKGRGGGSKKTASKRPAKRKKG